MKLNFASSSSYSKTNPSPKTVVVLFAHNTMTTSKPKSPTIYNQVSSHISYLQTSKQQFPKLKINQGRLYYSKSYKKSRMSLNELSYDIQLPTEFPNFPRNQQPSHHRSSFRLPKISTQPVPLPQQYQYFHARLSTTAVPVLLLWMFVREVYLGGFRAKAQ